MASIKQLPDYLIAQIAAGEVIEGPHSVVKELVENSLDAQADKIEIILENNGLDLILVRDNGAGISGEDLPLALTSFATSKISALEDLHRTLTMGFRGEALGSIAAIAEVKITSKAKNSHGDFGYSITAVAAKIDQVVKAAIEEGTQIEVKNLFFSTPVRKQFLAKDNTLQKKCVELISDISLAHYQVEFRLTINGKKIFSLPKRQNLAARIIDLHNEEFIASLMPFYHKIIFDQEELTAEGYISNFNFYKSNGNFIKIFVNERLIEFKQIIGSLRYQYGELLPPGRFPIAYIFLNIPQNFVDVNVHPQKKEVRFKREDLIKELIVNAIAKVINQSGPLKIQQFTTSKKTFLKEFDAPLQGSIDTLLLTQKSIEQAFQESSLPGQVADEMEVPTEEERPWPRTAHARLFQTFLLASSEQGLFLVDQHTAHERINYERFLKKLKAQQAIAQNLLLPKALHLSPAELMIWQKKKTDFEKLGFDFEDLGPAGIRLCSAPFFIHQGDEEAAFHQALRYVQEHDSIDKLQLFDQMAKDLSCKASIRLGDDESSESLLYLLENLKACDNPWRCPHGRPTIIFLGRQEIFELFKRQAP